MSAFFNLLAMAAAMGVAAFGVGLLPLSVSLSKTHLAHMSTLGSGLLVGAAIGVVIPE